MALPPPKLRNLTSVCDKNVASISKSEVWEIPVPPKTSLYWSILLAYLMSVNNDSDYVSFLEKLAAREAKKPNAKKRNRKPTCTVALTTLKKCLSSFNPFKNRYVFFHNLDMVEIMRTFKLRLNQRCSELRSEHNKLSDEIKLDIASEMLDCKIEVYFPGEKENKKEYSRKLKTNNSKTIVLFEYKDQKYRGLTENINIFRFALNYNDSYSLQLSALGYILKIAKIQPHVTQQVKQSLQSCHNHGKCFLQVILQGDFFEILPHLYKSPYISLKLSEAGFETNPTETEPKNPSPFMYAMTKPDTKFTRILYDYASNCRYLFDRTARDADESVLCSLNDLHGVISEDNPNIYSCNFSETTTTRLLRIQKEFLHFNKYQQDIATKMKDLRSKLLEGESKESVHKIIIQSILDLYTNFFYYESLNSNVSETYINYLTFTEYYGNTDCFSGLLFFDNIHSLKKVFQLKNQDIYSNIESKFLLLILSNKMFPKYQHEIECRSYHDEAECEKDKNILQLIPLFYRETLKGEINSFQEILKLYDKSEISPGSITKNEIRRNKLPPEIRDELLIFRLKYYLKAAIETPVEEGNVISVLAIERALQVLGESIKPQTTKGCVVSYLLNSRLPSKLRTDLILIRDNISHYKGPSSKGRLNAENIVKLFRSMQTDIEKIRKSFEIIAFTQHLRIEEFLMNNSDFAETFKKSQLSENMKEKLRHECKKRLNASNIDGYEEYRLECIKLSSDVLNNLKEHLNNSNLPNKVTYEKVHGTLKALEYVFLFLNKRLSSEENTFESCLEELKSCITKYETEKKIEILNKDIESFQNKYLETIQRNFVIDNLNLSLECPTLQLFFISLKKSNFVSSEVTQLIKAIENACDEAIKSKEELTKYAELESFRITRNGEATFNKLLASKACVEKLKKYFQSSKKKLVLKELSNIKISKALVVEKVKDMFKNNFLEDKVKPYLLPFLLKITFQRKLKDKIYTSVNLNDDLCNKLEGFLTNKVQFLINRIEDIKYILIDEDDEIKDAWEWGKSKAIKHHMKFLMRQRFLKELPVRASLEMAFFDCLNILTRPEFKEIFEKLNNLFTGLNLRDTISHGHCLLETAGAMLDKDDLPSEFINKMLSLIEDGEVIKLMLKLIPASDTLVEENFKAWIETNEEGEHGAEIKKIICCPRWSNYLFLLPLF